MKNNEVTTKLILFSQECVKYLNDVRIVHNVGKYKLELSTRTISDVIEKHIICFAIDYFGAENVKYGDYNGYDVIIIDYFEEKVYVNIKTNLTKQPLDATWLASASVIERLIESGIAENLYCTKLEYSKESEFVTFISGKVAGPVAKLKLIKHTKGERPIKKIRTEFNGTHYHILNEDYR